MEDKIKLMTPDEYFEHYHKNYDIIEKFYPPYSHYLIGIEEFISRDNVLSLLYSSELESLINKYGEENIEDKALEYIKEEIEQTKQRIEEDLEIERNRMAEPPKKKNFWNKLFKI